MSSNEAEREEMKDETHELDDMEQDDLDEDDSKDEASWINECLFDNQRINKKIMQKKTLLKDNTKLSFRHSSSLSTPRGIFEQFFECKVVFTSPYSMRGALACWAAYPQTRIVISYSLICSFVVEKCFNQPR